ncbi:MAG: RNA 2',3'-cyclic phosphodiesterase [Thermoplasmatales archaeon]
MRCFVAVDIGINEAISGFLRDLKNMGKVVEGENIHLTLKFLGEIESTAAIEKGLSEIKFPKFKLILKGLDAFPNLKRGRILFLNATPLDNISSLASEIDARTSMIPLDHPFHPHVTVLRLREPKDLTSLASRFESVVFAQEYINSFHLYQSTLTSRGPVYKIIKSFQLI